MGGVAVVDGVYPPSGLPGRFPETIPEASESLVLPSPPQRSSLSSPSPEVEYKLHRRQASRGGGGVDGLLQMSPQQQPTSTPSLPALSRARFSTSLSKCHRDKGFWSLLSRCRASFCRKYRGISPVDLNL